MEKVNATEMEVTGIIPLRNGMCPHFPSITHTYCFVSKGGESDGKGLQRDSRGY